MITPQRTNSIGSRYKTRKVTHISVPHSKAKTRMKTCFGNRYFFDNNQHATEQANRKTEL